MSTVGSPFFGKTNSDSSQHASIQNNNQVAALGSLFNDFWKSAVDSAVEKPATAIGQLFNPNFDWEPIKPNATRTGSIDYFAQGVGSALGLVADFTALKGGIKTFGKTGLAADLHVAST